MEVRAELRQLRISPRKVRLLAGIIRGKDVNVARHQLNVVVKKSSGPMIKLLNSAVANATNNFNIDADNLFIKDVNVDEGPKLKRGRPKGFGRTSPIEKKTSHIRIILEEKVAGKTVKKAKKDQPVEIVNKDFDAKTGDDKFEAKKPEVKKEISRKTPVTNIGDRTKKLFRRKAV